MCGRYNLTLSPNELQEFFDLFRAPPWSPRYNIAPTQSVLTIRFDEEATPREPGLLRWGLIPSWAKDEKIGNRLINARGETVAEKPSFRSAFKRRRCLIPATGFYEWQQQPGSTKQPYHITMADGRPFAFAGLWEHWAKGPSPIETCTIITTAANDDLQPIHERMPVILPKDRYDQWLDPTGNSEQLTELLRPFHAAPLKAIPIGTLVNNVRNDVPECLSPLE